MLSCVLSPLIPSFSYRPYPQVQAALKNGCSIFIFLRSILKSDPALRPSLPCSYRDKINTKYRGASVIPAGAASIT